MVAPATPRLEVCADPIFVIGSPRSGTSGLAWSLAQHSGCWTSEESDILHALFGRGHFDEAFERVLARKDGSWFVVNDVDRAELLAYIGLGFNALFTSRSEGKRWIDQSPTYTLCADVIADMFPGASFVHIFRDGRQVVNSMIKSGFAIEWSTDFGEACRAWSHFSLEALRFCGGRPERARTVTMGALTAEPELWFGRLQDWLRLPPEPAPAAFFGTTRINSSYRGRSRTPEPDEIWDSWTDEQREVFTEYAGETLALYRQADSSPLQVTSAG